MGWSWGSNDIPANLLTLTDAERIVLAKVAAAGETGVNDEDLGGRDTAHAEALTSLGRFGYVHGEYQHPDYTVRPLVPSRGWVYTLTERGQTEMERLRSRLHRCEEGVAVILPCVCHESRYCTAHGSQCVGTHD